MIESNWVVGCGNGITGPTSPNCGGPTVSGSEYPYQIVSCGKETVAIIPMPECGEGMDGRAYLIAAAPELLDALEDAVALCKAHGYDMRGAGQIIAKARGEV